MTPREISKLIRIDIEAQRILHQLDLLSRSLGFKREEGGEWLGPIHWECRDAAEAILRAVRELPRE